MDIHKPKAWHGVREFLKEYAIIFVGVLTALAAEQGVEWLHGREAVDALRQGVRVELAHNRNRWEQNRSQDACVGQRLEAIQAWARTAPPQARVTGAHLPRHWNLHASAWDTAKANPAATRLPVAEHMAYSELYDALAGQQRDLNDEHKGWVEIDSLLQEGDSAEDKRALRRLVVVEKDLLRRRRANYPFIFNRLDELHIPVQPLSPDDRVAATALCAPLAPPPGPPRGRGG